ncbi:MAG: hypothetical protein AAB674_02250 [Patescibacteria group bacterium]
MTLKKAKKNSNVREILWMGLMSMGIGMMLTSFYILSQSVVFSLIFVGGIVTIACLWGMK